MGSEPPILTLCGEFVLQTVRLQAEDSGCVLAGFPQPFRNQPSLKTLNHWLADSYLGCDFSQPPAPGSNIPISPAAGKQSDYVTLMLLQDIGSARVIIIIRD